MAYCFDDKHLHSHNWNGLRMRLSPEGLEQLIFEEGYMDTMYNDVRGLPTLGIGHLLTAEELATGIVRLHSGKNIGIYSKLTRDEVMELLRHDLYRFRKAVNRLNNINQGQFDALVIFSFNIGVGGFLRSTAYRMAKSGDHDKVPWAMKLWNKPKSIQKRRARTAYMYKVATENDVTTGKIKEIIHKPATRQAKLGKGLELAEKDIDWLTDEPEFSTSELDAIKTLLG